MTSPPIVSIVMAAYRAEATLYDALESVSRQTRSDWECIIVDDASDDDTRAIALTWSEQDPRFRVLSTSFNSGPSVARNLGFEAARGRWVTVLDSDDMFEPERLETLLRDAEYLDVDIIFDNQWLLNSRDFSRKRWLAIDDRTSRRYGLVRFLYQVSGLSRRHWGIAQPLFRRALLERHGIRYDPSLRFGEDALLMAQLISRTDKFGLSGNAGYVYRLPPENGANLSLRNNDDAELSTRKMMAAVGPVAGWLGRGFLRIRFMHYGLSAWRADLQRAIANRRYTRAAVLLACTPRGCLWLALKFMGKLLP
jgi:succinoglycan biosynthesis protein ExoO